MERKGRSHDIKATRAVTHTYTLTIKFIYFFLTSLMYSQMLSSCQVLHSISLRAQSFPLQVMGWEGDDFLSKGLPEGHVWRDTLIRFDQ